MPLPLPISALARRARNAKSPKERHDMAYSAWEASIRLAVAAQPPGKLEALMRPSAGQWVGALTVGEARLAQPELLRVHRLFTTVVEGSPSGRASITPRLLMDLLPAYRNRVIGHGSPRTSLFYASAGGDLLEGLDASWDAGLFWPQGAELVFIESISRGRRGELRGRLKVLAGDAFPVVSEAAVPGELLPERLYQRLEGRYLDLHPWLLFQNDDIRERVLFFNSRSKKSAAYLEFLSGEALDGRPLKEAFPDIEEDVERLFATASAPVAAEPEPAAEKEDEEYQRLGKLGSGGMGVVYLARQRFSERLVALKALPDAAMTDEVARARFKREIKALARCDHPNVVKILSPGESRGQLYYAMELIDGADLSRIADALGEGLDFDAAVDRATEGVRVLRPEAFAHVPLPAGDDEPRPTEAVPQALLRLFREAASALRHLHEQGIVHRDVKPSNMMVSAVDRRLVLMDLGLAAVSDASQSLTKDRASFLGTLRYTAPEQLESNDARADPRGDIYALGVAFWEVFSGRRLFDAETEARLIRQITEGPKFPDDVRGTRMLPGVREVLQKATAKDPRARYQAASELEAALVAVAAAPPPRPAAVPAAGSGRSTAATLVLDRIAEGVPAIEAAKTVALALGAGNVARRAAEYLNEAEVSPPPGAPRWTEATVAEDATKREAERLAALEAERGEEARRETERRETERKGEAERRETERPQKPVLQSPPTPLPMPPLRNPTLLPVATRPAASPDGDIAYFQVSTSKFRAMSFATFGLYTLYWFYKQWSAVRRATRRKLSPLGRATLPVVFARDLFREIRKSASKGGVQTTENPDARATAYVVRTLLGVALGHFWSPLLLITLLGVAPLAKTQDEINALLAARGPSSVPNDRYSATNIVLMVLSLTIWGSVLFGK